MAVIGSFGAARASALKAANPAPDPDLINFCGEEFRVADSVGAMPLMRFARAAAAGVDSADADGLAAMYDMVRDCIHADDWARFEHTATINKVDGEVLMAVTNHLYQHFQEKLTGNPTSGPTDSTDGPQTTSNSSSGQSSPPPASPGLPHPEVMQAASPMVTANGYSGSLPVSFVQ